MKKAWELSGRRTLRYVYIRDSCITCICISYLRANAVVGSLALRQSTRLRMSAFRPESSHNRICVANNSVVTCLAVFRFMMIG